jgi:hypothetical protein
MLLSCSASIVFQAIDDKPWIINAQRLRFKDVAAFPPVFFLPGRVSLRPCGFQRNSQRKLGGRLAQFTRQFVELPDLGVGCLHRVVRFVDHLRNAFDVAGDAVADLALLARGIGYVARLGERGARAFVDFAQRLRGFLDQLDTQRDLFAHAVHARRGSAGIALDGVDCSRDVLRRAARSLGELAHLVGDDGKTTPLFAGARRFNRRVEREQVGLVGDLLDHGAHSADFARAVD